MHLDNIKHLLADILVLGLYHIELNFKAVRPKLQKVNKKSKMVYKLKLHSIYTPT